MKYWGKYISIVLCFIFAGSFYALSQDTIPLQNQQKKQDTTAPKDTVKTLYPVAKIVPEDYKDLKQAHPIDLTTPAIFSDDFQYNPKTNRYELRSKIGDKDISTPLIFTREEYYEYSMKKSMDSYFRNKYSEEFQQKDSTKKDALSLFDFKFDLGPAEKIFGPGGVKLTPQGSVLTKFGFTHTSTGNPTLTERQRNRLAFDFDSQIEANVAASVGDKVNFDLNYNTESTFDYDTRKMKLGYTGKEDEIVKVLEAGNVSMNTTNSLIRGGSALFGIKTELQFGKLTVGAIFSQQESQSRSISTKGTVQTTPFEIPVDKYDENMHYFLGHYFRDNYDEAMSSLPYIKSGIKIDRIEVWITNKRSNYNEARNIVAFPDLGEHDHISNTQFTQATGTEAIPYNNANNLYAKLISAYPNARDISMVNQVFEGTPMVGGHDYEKIENARKLDQGEYQFNSQLGYISLRTPLQPDEVLAVAYSYIYRGVSYQVGEFSTDNPGGSGKNLFVKAIKGSNVSPISPTWKLMMRNVYTIAGNRNIEKEKFRLNIKYQNDTTGVFLNYITEGAIANKLLLSIMNLDRLDSKNEPYPDGFFDFVESYTVIPQTGKIIFPVAEPFGEHLRRKIGNDEIANKYVFQELYDSTLTVARQTAEKNKFIIQGEYKGAAGSNLQVSDYGGVARGSVTVSANGVRLKENVDYIVDYSTGGVTIINPAYENANIDVSSEDTSGFNMQRAANPPGKCFCSVPGNINNREVFIARNRLPFVNVPSHAPLAAAVLCTVKDIGLRPVTCQAALPVAAYAVRVQERRVLRVRYLVTAHVKVFGQRYRMLRFIRISPCLAGRAAHCKRPLGNKGYGDAEQISDRGFYPYFCVFPRC
ncbi:hypothetical protein FACS1894123_04640 [Bacteroidia bacterium]|nr:hypothetical protein FACS1894123_04640 [Bacteroidia bacterium]